MILSENVANANRAGNHANWTSFWQQVEQLGYHWNEDVVDAANFGVPQHRRRLITMALRSSSPPGPLNRIAIPKSSGAPVQTAREAIGHLPPIHLNPTGPATNAKPNRTAPE